MSWVYIITNDVNDKLYVGLTDHDDPRTRWEEHLHDYCHQDKGLYRAMRKHGEEHFCFEVIQHFSTHEEAALAEIFWIAELKTNRARLGHHGYNETDGGDGGRGHVCPEHIKQRFKQLYTGKKNPAHSLRMTGQNNPNFGKPRTAEWKSAHSRRISGENHPMCKVNWDIVRLIRTSTATHQELATRFDISIMTVSNIRNHKTWKE
jgi:group I intron endonuclease